VLFLFDLKRQVGVYFVVAEGPAEKMLDGLGQLQRIVVVVRDEFDDEQAGVLE